LIELDTKINSYKQNEKEIISKLKNEYENIRRSSLTEILEQYGYNKEYRSELESGFENYYNSQPEIRKLRNNIQLLENRINEILQ
jgi:hypothetical protein